MVRTCHYLVLLSLVVALSGMNLVPAAENPWVVYDGYGGPGKGKHIVLISGDDEYRSEEALPQLGKILARHHGFKCTVLFAIDKNDGTINPAETGNIPGLDNLKSADLMIIFARFRALPDDQMKMIDDYIQSGRPVIGLRTSTHAFRFGADSTSNYKQYDFQSKTWEGGFGRQVLGETWKGHHGVHKVQSTRGVIVPEMKDHPILRGVENIWGPTDVYVVTLPMLPSCKPLVLGHVLTGMKPIDEPVVGEFVQKTARGEVRKTPNDPMMPVAWISTFITNSGKSARVFNTTMGASIDLANEGLRRLLVNAAYWCVGMENKIPPRSNVDIVGSFEPSFYGFGTHKKGLKPSDMAIK